MTTEYIVNEGFDRLILIFSGWGTDARPFMHLRKQGYDIILLSDYTGYNDDNEDYTKLIPILERYVETIVFAWSFGVRVATTLLERLPDTLRITRRVAFNGTPTHVHDLRGIPSATFRGTLAGLSEISVRKFHRRMFATATDYADFTENAPRRSFESLVSELQTFAALPPAENSSVWDLAVISDADRIFPFENQIRGWEGVETIVLKDAPHFPDMQMLIDRFVVDKQLVAHRFAGATDTYASHATVQHTVASELWRNTSNFLDKIADSTGLKILEIGVGDGTLTRQYYDYFKDADITLWDIAEIPLPDGVPSSAKLLVCDAETAIESEPAESYDIILSASTVQWFHSPGRFIRRLGKILRPGGIAAIALYGKGTFREIEAATGRSLSYLTFDQLKKAAAASGLEVMYAAEEKSTVSFPTVTDLMRHLKYTGVNSLGNGGSGDALRMLRNFQSLPDGSAPLTYHPLYLILKKSTEDK